MLLISVALGFVIFEHKKLLTLLPFSNELMASKFSSLKSSQKSSNLISFNTLNKGDEILGFSVVEIKPFNQELSMSEKNFIVKFSGTKTLSGKYFIDDTKRFYMKNVVLFEPDIESVKELPYIFSPKLEIRNDEVFLNLLNDSKKTGTVSLEISNYSSFYLANSSFGGGIADVISISK